MLITNENPEFIIPAKSKIAVEVLDDNGFFRTKIIRVMCNMKLYVFCGIISSRHRGYTFVETLPS